MSQISSGRKPKISKKAADTKGKLHAADVCAVLCALLCAVCLTYWSTRPVSSDCVAAAITYTPPEEAEPRGFWDYFSEAMANAVNAVFGLDD